MIKPMNTSVGLVGNSKVLAHIFPELLSPIDREYTMQFVNGFGIKKFPSSKQEFT